jgi:hypothetical protein
MSLSRSPVEGARHSVDLHLKGFLCPAEAWNGFVEHATEETFAECMAQLTPDLEAYVHHYILTEYPKLYQEAEPSPHVIKHRQALKWLADYYAR